MVEKAEETGASESLGNLFANADKADDLKEMEKAEETGSSELSSSLNADKADDLKEMVEKAEKTGASEPWATSSPMQDLKSVDLGNLRQCG